MRESRTVGWDSSKGEFQFIADEPGPLLIVTPELFAQAVQQRDTSWLLRGYTQPDHSEWCEFVVRAPTMGLARSMLPASSYPSPASQTGVEEPSEAPTKQLNWQPAPPQPASGQPSPVSFFQVRSDPVEQTKVVDLNWEANPPITPELYDKTEQQVQEVSTGYAGVEEWIVRYVKTDPHVRDETEHSLRVQADSDAAALRALHAEMRKTAEEPSYRVIALVPARQVDVAA